MKKSTIIVLIYLASGIGITFGQQDAALKRLIETEKFKQAKTMLQQNIELKPDDGANYYWLGKIHFSEARHDSALIYFKKGKDKTKNGWMNLIGMGLLSLDNKDSVTAKSNFSSALMQTDEKNFQYYYLVGDAWIHSEIRNSQNGLKMADKCLSLEKNNGDAMILQGDAWLLKLEGGGQALTSYENAADKYPASPIPLLKIGKLYLRAKNYSLGVDYLKKAITKDSTFAPAYRELAEYYFSIKKNSESRTNYEKFLANSDTTEEVLTHYLYTCFLSKDYEKSISLAEQLQGSNFNSFVLNRITAYSYYEKGKYPEGLTSIQQLFSNPDKTHLIADDYTYYGKLLAKSKQDSLAIIYFQQSFEKDSTNKDLLGDIGKSALNTGKHELARDMFQKKISQSTPIPLDYYNLGQALYYLKDYANADSAFLKLTVMQPAFYQGFLFRARCNNLIDTLAKTDVAKLNYEKVVEMAGADPVKNKKHLIESYDYLGFYAVQKDDKPNAIINFRKELELDPENKRVAKYLKDLNK